MFRAKALHREVSLCGISVCFDDIVMMLLSCLKQDRAKHICLRLPEMALEH